MKEIVIVGLGGFVGSASRYMVYLFTNSHYPDRSYLATLSVNLIGCLLIGLLSGGLVKLNQHSALFLVAGICGGFTTFSTFAMDGLKLLREGMYGVFIGYAAASMLGGLLVCTLGFYIVNRG